MNMPLDAILPDTAPFTPEQRAWLSGFFAALIEARAEAPPPKDGAVEEDFPWHDPALPLEDRMTLATGRPLKRRMMAAMAQQDCGQCGYDCLSYAEAIAEQAEDRLQLCVPGGKNTARMLKSLVEEMGGSVIDPERPAKLKSSRGAPAMAEFVSARLLNGPGSEKATFHIEIDLSGSGLDYKVGDSLGVYPSNDPALADAVLAAIEAPPDFPIAHKTLREVLISDMSLGLAPDMLFELISLMVGGERRHKAKLLAKGGDPDGDAATLDVLAALEKFPGLRPDPEAFVECLEPLQPRLYSISSSPKTCPGRIALTVDAVNYRIGARERAGVASNFLGRRMAPGEMLKVYVQPANAFGLPTDPMTPIIMVGPGTGVAPFRAFLEERAAVGACGPAWLFFGHQRAACDFFYADEFAAFQQMGVLSRLSLAWSRDGAQKIYVQDRMREAGSELWSWLERGAHFYVCGDATRMAKDVETALADIIAAHAGCPADQAATRIKALKAAGRYQSDVY